ncbi:MAG: hypothetical protein FJ290_07050 [Planctomycetes bacterium]|nr:hypothetical protein [Planctomycetota bacterium]
MDLTGDPSLWSDLVPDRFMPQIIALVLNGWESFEKPGTDDLEVPITKRFCCCLRDRKNQSRVLPFSIWWESPELDAATGTELGRIDLRFSHGHREDVYFAFECKRLNVVGSGGRLPSLAGEYVQEGMMRYVEGKYAGSLDKGGMLGYVMNGDVPAAIGAVGRSITARRMELKLSNGGLERSSIVPAEDRVRETRHSLDRRGFVIHHLFVAVG